MQDGKDLTITPNFVVNYANGEIIAEQDCEIYLDGEFLSKSSWKGLIELGEHKIECKKEKHRSTTKIIKLSSLNPVKYACEPPLPIYGSINISSDPINAEIKLNGEKIGVTPLNRANVLIGTYDIEISKQGYKSEKQQITVKENETSTLYKILSTYCNFTLSSVPSMATVYINDVYKGTTPIYINEKIGKYNIELKYSGYKDYSKNMTLDDSTTDQTIKLKKQFFYPNEFYMNFNGRIMGLSGIELGLGGYIKNFNMETSYIISFDKSDFIRFPNYLDEYFQYQYKYQGFGLRLGYGIICGSRIRTTSQIGVNLIKLVEYNIDNTRTSISYIGVTGVVATKISCALGRMFSLELSPEYSFILGGSTRYKLATNISEKMKHSTSGFTIKVGFNIFFSM
ncbi:MAG: PEGA domain-containing protein [Bacteroidales bacterium]|nr:PEGA domain-containing protein [Bacteroidales bacterium]